MKDVIYYLRPECGSENRWGPNLGPFDNFLQITYSDLRVGPEGDEIAFWREGGWQFAETFKTNSYGPEDPRGYKEIPHLAEFKESFGCTPENWHSLWWSDIIIWAVPRDQQPKE